MSLIEAVSAVRALFTGNLELLGGPKVAASIAPRLRAEQITSLARYTPVMMIANMLNASIVLLALWTSADRLKVITWGFSIISFVIFIYIKHFFRGARPRRKTISERIIYRAIINAFVVGALWSCLPLFFFSEATQSVRVIVLTITIGMLCGGAFVLAPLPIAGIAYLIPLATAASVTFIRMDDPTYLLVVGLLIIYTFALLRGMSSYASQYAIRFLAEIENEHAAQSDPLTKLPNRTAFDIALSNAASRSRRFGDGYAILFLDLDKFKEVNDEYGHGGGDEFLVQVAERLQMCIRETDVAARIAGDEFAILAANIDSPEAAVVMAERINKAFDAPFKIQTSCVNGACSIGIAMLPADGLTPEELMRKADASLYSAKREQRGTYRFFETSHEEIAHSRRQLEADLRTALKHDQFHLVFQPFMDATSLCTTGYEALLRWEHPVRGLIPPLEFVKLAEKAGLIHEIGEWVIHNAIAAASQWPDHLRVAINVSAAQFRTMEIVSAVKEALRESCVRPDRVELEITETLILGDIERAEAALRGLHNLGVSIALDDFGTGYSSLTHLISLPIDRIKIDRSFVQKLFTSSKSEALVRAVIMLAAQLKIGITAEGVETQEQFEYLQQAGCAELQGYLVSRPLRADKLAETYVSCFQGCAIAA